MSTPDVHEPVAPASEVPGFANPLAVRVGLYVSADDLPCEGWPAEFRSDVVERVLGYLPLDD